MICSHCINLQLLWLHLLLHLQSCSERWAGPSRCWQYRLWCRCVANAPFACSRLWVGWWCRWAYCSHHLPRSSVRLFSVMVRIWETCRNLLTIKYFHPHSCCFLLPFPQASFSASASPWCVRHPLWCWAITLSGVVNSSKWSPCPVRVWALPSSRWYSKRVWAKRVGASVCRLSPL